jgi:putative DNA primase/helicase
MHGVRDAMTDEAAIRAWWDQWPDANVGIATGRVSGLIVFDVDPRNGGDDSLARLEAEHGPLPDTVRSETGGGGEHVYFVTPATRIKNHADGKLLGQGVDVKADGGFVVAPPSLHVSGDRYLWEASSHPDDLEVAAMPPWLLARIQGANGNGRGGAEAIANLIRVGARNSTLASLAGTLRKRGCSKSEILAALQETNRVRCVSPLPEAEIEAIATSISRYEPGNGAPDDHGFGINGSLRTATEDVHETDLGNAERLVDRFGSSIRYCAVWRQFLIWDERRWAPDTTREVYRLASDTVRAIYGEAGDDADDQRRKALGQHALRSESERALTAMIELAKSRPGVPAIPQDFDRDPWLLTVANGTVDLRSGELRRHRRGDLITKLAPVYYSPGATCPMFHAFLSKIMGNNQPLIDFIQRALGYALTGVTRERCLFILFGTGSNGKSTLLEVFRALLGDYAMNTPARTLMAKRDDSIPNDVARLKGARFVTAVETAEGKRMDVELVKRMTGNDVLSARFMRGEWFDFQPEFKLFLATNHKPVIRDTTDSIWNRIKLIPFGVTIPEAEQDKELLVKLRGELPGVLRWAVDGCRRWQADGLGTPPEINTATKEYRREMDILGDFIDERCEVGETIWVTAEEIYQAYTQWAEASGEEKLSQKKLGKYLGERGFQRDKKAAGGRSRWTGVGLRGSA